MEITKTDEQRLGRDLASACSKTVRRREMSLQNKEKTLLYTEKRCSPTILSKRVHTARIQTDLP